MLHAEMQAVEDDLAVRAHIDPVNVFVLVGIENLSQETLNPKPAQQAADSWQKP